MLKSLTRITNRNFVEEFSEPNDVSRQIALSRNVPLNKLADAQRKAYVKQIGQQYGNQAVMRLLNKAAPSSHLRASVSPNIIARQEDDDDGGYSSENATSANGEGGGYSSENATSASGEDGGYSSENATSANGEGSSSQNTGGATGWDATSNYSQNVTSTGQEDSSVADEVDNSKYENTLTGKDLPKPANTSSLEKAFLPQMKEPFEWSYTFPTINTNTVLGTVKITLRAKGTIETIAKAINVAAWSGLPGYSSNNESGSQATIQVDDKREFSTGLLELLSQLLESDLLSEADEKITPYVKFSAGVKAAAEEGAKNSIKPFGVELGATAKLLGLKMNFATEFVPLEIKDPKNALNTLTLKGSVAGVLDDKPVEGLEIKLEGEASGAFNPDWSKLLKRDPSNGDSNNQSEEGDGEGEDATADADSVTTEGAENGATEATNTTPAAQESGSTTVGEAGESASTTAAESSSAEVATTGATANDGAVAVGSGVAAEAVLGPALILASGAIIVGAGYASINDFDIENIKASSIVALRQAQEFSEGYAAAMTLGSRLGLTPSTEAGVNKGIEDLQKLALQIGLTETEVREALNPQRNQIFNQCFNLFIPKVRSDLQDKIRQWRKEHWVLALNPLRSEEALFADAEDAISYAKTLVLSEN